MALFRKISAERRGKRLACHDRTASEPLVTIRESSMNEHWIAERMRGIEVSGIRKVFDLAANLKDPVNLSIGQPHFPVPEPIKAAAKKAIDDDKNGYTVTQGIAPLRDKILADLKSRYPGQERGVLITSGTSGGLALTLL